MKKGSLGFITLLLGTIGGIIGTKRSMGKKLKTAIQFSDKHLALFLMMNQWVRIKQEGKHISEYFRKYGYKRIAVYGMSYAGDTFVEELKNSDIEIVYGIDKNVNNLFSVIDIVSPEDDLETVDVIVVTAITFYEEVKEQLSEKLDCPIISLEDILYEI